MTLKKFSFCHKFATILNANTTYRPGSDDHMGEQLGMDIILKNLLVRRVNIFSPPSPV